MLVSKNSPRYNKKKATPKKKTSRRKSSSSNGHNTDPAMPSISWEERVSVRKIKNGYLINKSWSDKKGRYKSEDTYSSDNPLK